MTTGTWKSLGNIRNKGESQRVDRMTCPVEASQPLPSVTTALVQQALGYGGKDGGYAWAQQCELSLIKAHLTIATAECLTFQQQK